MKSAILILIVDEQETRGRLLERELSAEGFGVVHASTTRGALRIIEQQRPDLVVARDPSAGSFAELISAADVCSSSPVIGVGELELPGGSQVQIVRRSAELVATIRTLCRFPRQRPETD